MHKKNVGKSERSQLKVNKSKTRMLVPELAFRMLPALKKGCNLFNQSRLPTIMAHTTNDQDGYHGALKFLTSFVISGNSFQTCSTPLQ